MRRFIVGISLCASLVLAASGHAAARGVAHARAAALTKVVLATGFFPSVQFAPYYLAVDKGYYRAQGLDVQIQNGPSPTLPRQVADGKVDFYITGGDSLVQARAGGVPVTYVMAQFQRYPVGAMALAGTPLSSPADLKGRRIGISMPGSSTDIGLQALLQAGHLTKRDVKIIAIGFTETQSLVRKQVDVAMTYLTNEPVQARALGHKVMTLDTSTYITLISTGLATGASTLQNRPGLVQRMVNATLQGLRDTQMHPDQALTASLKRMPEIAGNAKQTDIQRQLMAATLPYEQAPVNHPLGWSDPRGWATTTSFMQKIGVLKGSVEPAALYTNSFAEQADASTQAMPPMH